MLKLEITKMQNAIAKAKAVHPKVTVVDAANRVYSVPSSNGGAYTVKFHVLNGQKFSECECAAGRKGQICYHVAAASAVNMGIQAMRQQTKMQDFYHRNVGWMV
jgi:hypothetical protein